MNGEIVKASPKTRMVLTVAERKKLLIAQGALHRLALSEARSVVQEGLQAKALARGVVGGLAVAAFSILKSRGQGGPSGSTLQTLLPLVLTGISMVFNKTTLKPAVRKTAFAGLVAVAAVFLGKKAWDGRRAGRRA